MAIRKYLNHNQAFSRAVGLGLADFTALKAFVEANATGFSVNGDIISSDLATSIRKDVDLGSEKLNLRLLANNLEVAQLAKGATEEPSGVTVADKTILFNEGSGTTATEKGGSDVFTLRAGGTAFTADAFGGSALQVNVNAGGADLTTGAIANYWNTGAFSYSMLIYVLDSAIGGENYIMRFEGTTITFLITPTGAVSFNGGNFGAVLTTPDLFNNPANRNRWARLTVTFSGGAGTAKIYLDDTEQVSQANTDLSGISGSILFGGHQLADSIYLKGNLDVWQYWNGYVLTPSEISTLVGALSPSFSGLQMTKDMSTLTYPLDATVITDSDGGSDASMLSITTDQGGLGTTVRHFYAGLSNRTRETWNLKIAAGQTLSSGNLTVGVILPKNDTGAYFVPPIYDATSPNFKPLIQLYSQSTADSESASLDGTASFSNINLGAGTADLTMDAVVGSYGPDSLLGINPQPLLLLEGEAGQTIETGAVESITLIPLGVNKDNTGVDSPPGVGAPKDLLVYGYGTTEARRAGKVLGYRNVSSTDTVLDQEEGGDWETANGRSVGKSRLWEARLISGGAKIAIPKTNFI